MQSLGPGAEHRLAGRNGSAQKCRALPSLGKVVPCGAAKGPPPAAYREFCLDVAIRRRPRRTRPAGQPDQPGPKLGARPLANGPVESLWVDPRSTRFLSACPCSQPTRYLIRNRCRWVRLGACNISIPWQLGQPRWQLRQSLWLESVGDVILFFPLRKDHEARLVVSSCPAIAVFSCMNYGRMYLGPGAAM